MQIIKDDYLSFLTIKKGLAKESVRRCISVQKILTVWCEDNNETLSKKSVEAFFYYLREERGLNNNSLNSYLFGLRMLLDYLKDRNQLKEDFLSGMKSFKKSQPLITVLTPEEIEQLINTEVEFYGNRGQVDPGKTYAANLNYGTMAHFLAMTGCRFSEAANLRVKYVDTTLGIATFTHTKNYENRRAFIGEPLLSRMEELIVGKKDTEYVFTNTRGNPVIQQDFSAYLQRLKRKAGIVKRVHPHIFRHSMATQLLMEGVDISIVATLLGHKDIQTTFKHYAHLADQSIKRAQFRHPLLRKNLSTEQVLRYMKEAILGSMTDDERFEHQLSESGDEIVFVYRCKAKQ